MNKKSVIEAAVDRIDPAFIEDALIQMEDAGRRRNRRIRITKALMSAAALIALSLGLYAYMQNRTMRQKEEAFQETVAAFENRNAADQSQTALRLVQTGDRISYYRFIGDDSNESGRLSAFAGSTYTEDTGKWYKIAGKEDVHYLLEENENGYSLWEYLSFYTGNSSLTADFEKDVNTDAFRFSEVLSKIYGIESADRIASVTFTPAFETASGAADTSEQIIVKDGNTILQVYRMMTQLVPYGDREKETHRCPIRSDIFLKALESDLKKGEHQALRYIVRIEILSKDGNRIGNLTYSAIDGTLYEKNSNLSITLSEEEAGILDRFCGIGAGYE